MTEHTPLESELAGIIAETFYLNADIDSNRPDIIETIWDAAKKVAIYVQQCEEDKRKEVISEAKNIIRNRIEDLTSCHKDDDCDIVANGAQLAWDDLDWHLDGGKEQFDDMP